MCDGWGRDSTVSRFEGRGRATRSTGLIKGCDGGWLVVTRVATVTRVAIVIGSNWIYGDEETEEIPGGGERRCNTDDDKD
ncbi:hypothetical protein U1Q18_015334 [Sarracenia purpurea var. burkii]